MKETYTSILKKYPTYRDDSLKACFVWLEGRRIDDEAEDLWRVGDKLYDVSDFVNHHPGGKEWLQMTKGTDITEVFITTHLTKKPYEKLEKFYVRDAKQPRNYIMTFEEDGFYQSLRRKIVTKFEKNLVDKRPLKWSKILFDLVLLLTFASAASILWMNYAALKYLMIIITGVLIQYVDVMAHNFVHQRNNWRMRMSFLTLISWRDWRIFHVLFHHPYPNTYTDLQVTTYAPYINFLPTQKSKNFVAFSYYLTLIAFPFSAYFSLIHRVIGSFISKSRILFFDELIALTIPLTIFVANPHGFSQETLKESFIIWLIVLLVSGVAYNLLGLIAGHHAQNAIHEGDEFRSTDFGIFQMSAIVERDAANSNLFMSLTHFGHHTLHHLFPTIDHAILPQFYEDLIETCNEFKHEIKKYSMWNALKEVFQQIAKTDLVKLPQYY